MKAENMKLPDLQTGKYLELGKEWLYGGNRIIIYPQTFYEALKKSHIFSKGFDIVSLSEPQGILKTLCDKTGALVYGGRYVLLSQERADIYDVDCYHNDWSLRQYVKEYRTIGLMLKTHFIVGKNILKVADIKNIVESTYFEGMKDITVNDKFGYIDNGNAKFVIYYAKGNIFEEYSKQLRNEPNKFDELKEHFK